MSEPIKVRRSRDGCQSCKKSKIKCDRNKPTCNVCIRRGSVCDYTKKIVWINTELFDARHPSFKNRKSNSKSNSSTIIAAKDVKLNNIPNYVAHSNQNNGQINEQNEQNEQNEEDGNQNALVLLNDPMANTSEYYEQIEEIPNLRSKILEQKTFNFIKLLNPDISKIFYTKHSAAIYDHYLRITCSALDPLHGSGSENISQKFFLPLALNDPSILHGILSISSSQLSNSNSNSNSPFKELSLVHKSLAYKHLYMLLASPKKSISLEALSAIICQLSIEIIQSGVKNWKIHIQALRRIINERKLKDIKADQTAWFIYLRVARYDNFASLTTGDKPLFNYLEIKQTPEFKTYHPTIQNIDCIFGCPSDVLFFCSELSHISKWLYSGKSLDDLNYSNDSLQLKLFEIFNNDYDATLADDWSCLRNLWCSAMGIHFYQCLLDTNHSEYTNIYMTTFFKALSYILTLDSYYCANLLWPILKIGTVLSEDYSHRRQFLIESIDTFYLKTKIGAFIQLKSLLREIWELIDDGKYNKPSDWWKYQEIRDSWNIYLA